MNKKLQTMEMTEKKKQQPSKSYTLKSFAENIQKFKAFGWMDEQDEKLIEEIKQRLIEKYTKDEFNNK